MNKIIVSINPIYVKNILNETKKYEYRRVAAKQDVKSILIYETAPIKMVVAEVEILEVLECSPEELWDKTKDLSGTSKQFFDAYFAGKDIAYAYKLGKVTPYENPKSLKEYGVKYAPQSFIYYNEI